MDTMISLFFSFSLLDILHFYDMIMVHRLVSDICLKPLSKHQLFRIQISAPVSNLNSQATATLLLS